MGPSERFLRQEIAQSAWKLMGMISRKGNPAMKERTATAVALREATPSSLLPLSL